MALMPNEFRASASASIFRHHIFAMTFTSRETQCRWRADILSPSATSHILNAAEA